MVLAYRYNLKLAHLPPDNPGAASMAMTAATEHPSMTSKKPAGVIATIVATISRANGASIEEIVAVLSQSFPDRDAAGMRSTTLIHANKHCTAKDRDDKRGLVYYKRR